MKKKVLVIGLGDFGKTIAQQLLNNEVTVKAIDVSKKIVDDAAEELSGSIKIIQADATKIDTLEELETKDYDTVVVAIGKHDSKAPVIIVHNLHVLGAQHIVTRGHKEDAEVLKKLGAHRVIIPEIEAAVALADTISKSISDDIVERDQFGGEEVIRFQVDKDSCWLEQTIQTLRNYFLKKQIDVEIKSIEQHPADTKNGTDADKKEKKPDPDYILELNDYIVIGGKKSETEMCDAYLDKAQKDYEEQQTEEEKIEKENKKNNKNSKNNKKKK